MDVRELTLKLEENANAIGLDIDLLVDVEVLLGQLVDNMTDAACCGNTKDPYVYEYNRKLRVYRDVIHRSVGNLANFQVEVHSITQQLTQTARGDE
jgi:hypothetical protein